MSYADRIILQGMQFFAYHGMYAEEARVGQRFLVDVEMTLSTDRAGREDRLEHTVDYSKVFADVQEVVTGSRYGLLERLAHVVAERLLDRYPIGEVVVRVHKPEAPLPGTIQDVVVEIRRQRFGTAEGGEPPAGGRPKPGGLLA